MTTPVSSPLDLMDQDEIVQENVVSVSDQPVHPVDERLASFIQDDPIYQDMLRALDREKIRMRLAIRYTLLMFGIFLVFAWIVSNRVIMFGFSEFIWLSRIRDGLFGLMAGLFSLTVWYGSPVWFQSHVVIMMLRIMACIFFVGVLVALYFPMI